MAHPDSLTGADVFAVPDRSLSPTDPAELVAWLRALPLRAVVLDNEDDACQIKYDGPLVPYRLAWAGGSVNLGADRAGMLAARAPFRLIWTSGGGQPVGRSCTGD